MNKALYVKFLSLHYDHHTDKYQTTRVVAKNNVVTIVLKKRNQV